MTRGLLSLDELYARRLQKKKDNQARIEARALKRREDLTEWLAVYFIAKITKWLKMDTEHTQMMCESPVFRHIPDHNACVDAAILKAIKSFAGKTTKLTGNRSSSWLYFGTWVNYPEVKFTMVSK